ncbi:hypothetical protein CBL18_27480, partial [Shigella flexneri]
MDLLAQTGLPLWWGILVMAIGAISALLGVDVWRNGQNRYFRHPEVGDGSAGANGFASVVGHSGDGDRRNLRAPGR